MTLPPIDMEAVLAEEEAERSRGGPVPFRYGTVRDVDLGMQNAGTWEDLDDGGRLWRLRIRSAGAYSIDLVYSEFHIPPGARFYLYDPEHATVNGAFTRINNKPNGRFTTAPLEGDETVLEYYEPRKVSGQGRITVTRVIHAYKETFVREAGGEGSPESITGPSKATLSCPYTSISCSGSAWEADVRRAVVRITSGAGHVCSGSLINNTGTLEPYVLTADHCDGSTNRVEPGNTIDWTFIFNHCGSSGQQISQATVLARMDPFDQHSDHMLLKLSEDPPPSYDVYYPGWDRRDVLPTFGMGIHHPGALGRKKAVDNDPVSSEQQFSTSSDYDLSIYWNDGYVDHGSSGSPLFNQDKRIVGQLTQFHPDPEVPKNSCGTKLVVLYGALSWAWDYTWSPNGQFCEWLDPANLCQQQTLDGTNPPPPPPPDAPTNLWISGDLGEPPHLTWTGSAGATEYDVYRCEDTNPTCVDFDFIGSTSNTFYDDLERELADPCGGHPTHEITHYYVIATNSAGESDPSGTAGDCTEPAKGGVTPATIPDAFALQGNYPNPFNPSTEIRFELPEAAHVRLEIYDALGRVVDQLVDGPMDAGYRRVSWDASDFPSGVYLYRLDAGSFSETRRMVLTK